ncbi:MAG: hypothetical protein GY820_17295 [Gammaproteobacteria bacterium]|nr:hypothetical protein [Gammaproteobacteria bacterium]
MDYNYLAMGGNGKFYSYNYKPVWDGLEFDGSDGDWGLFLRTTPHFLKPGQLWKKMTSSHGFYLEEFNGEYWGRIEDNIEEEGMKFKEGDIVQHKSGLFGEFLTQFDDDLIKVSIHCEVGFSPVFWKADDCFLKSTDPWIYDRLPEEKDANENGDVFIYNKNIKSWQVEHWTGVNEGTPWQHIPASLRVAPRVKECKDCKHRADITGLCSTNQRWPVCFQAKKANPNFGMDGCEFAPKGEE